MKYKDLLYYMPLNRVPNQVSILIAIVRRMHFNSPIIAICFLYILCYIAFIRFEVFRMI